MWPLGPLVRWNQHDLGMRNGHVQARQICDALSERRHHRTVLQSKLRVPTRRRIRDRRGHDTVRREPRRAFSREGAPRWIPYIGGGPNFALSHQSFEAPPPEEGEEVPEEDDDRFDFSDT